MSRFREALTGRDERLLLTDDGRAGRQECPCNLSDHQAEKWCPRTTNRVYGGAMPPIKRVDPPLADSEAATVRGFLDYQRDTLRMKTEGLDQAQLAATLATSTMTLGGILKHLAYVENSWFFMVFDGTKGAGIWRGVDWKMIRTGSGTVRSRTPLSNYGPCSTHRLPPRTVSSTRHWKAPVSTPSRPSETGVPAKGSACAGSPCT